MTSPRSSAGRPSCASWRALCARTGWWDSRDRRDGRDRQNGLCGTCRPPARSAIPGRADFPSAARAYAGAAADDPADALASLLQIFGVTAQQIPAGREARTSLWRDRLAGQRLLLLLDDAAGHEQVRPLLPGTPGSPVLVTSRRHLTALEEARAISFDTLPPAEAAELLVRLADRPDLTPGDAAVGEITRLCGFLPLAVGMLARQLHHHPAGPPRTWPPTWQRRVITGWS
jgi:hypothetical protein